MNDTQTPGADPEGAAARLLGDGAEPTAAPARRGRGRPKGSRTRPRATGTRPPAREPEGAEAPAYDTSPPTEAEVQAMAVLGGVVWSLAAVKAGGLKPLEPEEALQLGTAMVPVFRKYAGLLGGFEAEVTLLLVIAGLVAAKQPDPRPEEITLDGLGSRTSTNPGAAGA